MSGLCGWFGPEPGAIALEHMAAPIGRFDRTPLRGAAHGHGAAALSGSIDCTSLSHEDGLIVALWGGPGQQAHTLAQHWRSHGARAGAALSGQFAFAILDERRGEVLLCVDRLATRPLYYQLCGATLLFASSQDALLRHPLAGRQESQQALYHYLVLGAMPGSAWHGQHQLGPGECVHLRGGQLLRQHWWQMRFDEHAQGRGEGLDAAVQAALAQAAGHQHPGIMLSGGAASAALAAQLQAQAGAGADAVPTFSVSYCPDADARPGPDRARRAAHMLGTRHHHQVVQPADLVEAVPKLAALSDRPCADSSAVAHYHCALLARTQGTLRLYSGAGLADLFGAGPLATAQARMSRYARLPAPLRELLIDPLLRLNGAAFADLPARLVHDSPFTPALLGDALIDQVDLGGPLAQLRAWWWSAHCRSAGNRAIALDLHASLPARLAAGQLGCFLAGVDLAHPYLEDAVLDCAGRADPRHKHPGHFARHARALRALLPGSLGRTASATVLPFTVWLQTESDVRALAFDSLSSLRRRHIVAGRMIDALLGTTTVQLAPGFGKLVWQLMMLEQWFTQRAPHRLVDPAPAPCSPACSGSSPAIVSCR